ncbi:MAG: methyltransferase domain-containing protein [Desulfobacteraceae bacterium]|nr:methyltransferase domain-containing protein [Desulfobacteraceae bacterium]
MIKKDLLQILECPFTHDRLNFEEGKLVNEVWRIKYPIHREIPILLIDEIELPSGVGSIEELVQKTEAPSSLRDLTGCHDARLNRAIIDHFTYRSSNYDSQANWVHSGENLDAITRFLGQIFNHRACRALDLGCGTGALFGILSSFVDNMIGVDICLAMLERNLDFGRNLICSLAERLPFKPNIFDIVISRQAFHYFDLKWTLQEIKRVLKPDGILVIIQIASPEGEVGSWVSRFTTMRQKHRRHVFTHSSLISLITHIGFSLVHDILWRDRSSTRSFLSYETSHEKIIEILTFFRQAPSDVANSLAIVERNGHYEYNRYWSFVAFKAM